MKNLEITINGVAGIWISNEEEVALPAGYISPHFREAEFTCNHCNSMEGNTVPQELLAILEDVREHFDAPVTVNSGYRCRTHNNNVGSSENSWHRYKIKDEGAADIAVSGVSPARIQEYLLRKYPNSYGIGSYPTFTHIDNRKSRGRW